MLLVASVIVRPVMMGVKPSADDSSCDVESLILLENANDEMLVWDVVAISNTASYSTAVVHVKLNKHDMNSNICAAGVGLLFFIVFCV